MEEDHLLKERFQAITDKKKVQNDIAVKRMEIDKEKLKFQYLKKKVVREQWLMEGQTAPSGQGWEVSRPQVEEQQEQIRTLQSSIYRMEREVEALERQEIIISMNEGFILKRLKAVEKSPEDIIKAAKSGEEGAVYAMEINLQEDKGTGESPALSTGTIRPQWAQWNGVNIKDEGRRSVFALHSDGQDFINGVDELSPGEVEQLLSTATKQTFRSIPKCHDPGSPMLSPTQPNPRRPMADKVTSESSWVNGVNISPNSPKVMCNETAQFQKCRYSMVSSCIPFFYGDIAAGQFPLNISHSPKSSSKIGESKTMQSTQNSKYGSGYITKKTPRESPHLDAKWKNENPPLPYSQNSLPADLDPLKPVTMIFMGYQTISDHDNQVLQSLGYDGAIQAELVVIASDDDDEGDLGMVFCPTMNPGLTQYLAAAQSNCNITCRPITVAAHIQETKPIHPVAVPSPDMATDGDVIPDAPSAGNKAFKKRRKLCCSLM